MAKGMALALGLNLVDPKHYAGWSGDLNACEADAEDMTAVAQSKGFQVTTLMTKNATRERVIDELAKGAKDLKSGDIFLLSYSGHGGQLPDLNDDEADAQDETWCLYNGELVDDELYKAFAQFQPGVRILVFSDSCHSGSVVKMAYYHGTSGNHNPALTAQAVKYRSMPTDVALRTYRTNKDFYGKILADKKLKESREAVKASVLLISGCQDNQLSSDGDFNGLFTAQMLRVWKNGAYKGNYKKFHRAIVLRMPPDQTPNYFWGANPDRNFERQVPFTI